MKKLLASRTLRHTALWLAASLAALGLTAWLGADPLLQGIAVLAVGLGAIRLCGLFLFRALLPAAGLATPRIAEEVSLLLAYVAWAMLRLRLAGMDLAQLVTTSAVITAVVAFAMQDTLGNVLSGLFLELDRSIMIGDWVKLDDLSGRVVEIRWRHTAIRTRNGELAIVPNSALMKARFLVITQAEHGEGRWRRWVWFDVDFDVPPARVIAAARRALLGAEIPNVARDPAPDCVLMELALGQARYALRYWLLDPRHDDGTDSAVRMHLLAALERKGIAPSLPKQMTHEFKETEERDAARRAREVDSRAEVLRGVELFSMLTEEERHRLAAHLVPAPFAAGDVVTRQGMVAHWLYLLAEGEVDIWLEAKGEGAGGTRTRLATLQPGSVFGEMGMMTGEPRRATVTARSDVQCYRLDKEGFAGVLHARPEIAEGLARVLAKRGAELAQAAQQASAAAPQARHEGLVERIRAFFGLEAAVT